MGAAFSSEPDLFVPREKRWCTDILFLIFFICCWAAGITLSVVTVNKDPSLFESIFYPKDSYGNNCGKPGTATEHLPKVFFPQLDTDILEQLDVFESYRYWEFKPTRLCAAECPSGFNLANPVLYGGPTYPCGYDDTEYSSGMNVSTEFGTGETCATGSVPSTYYIYVTQSVVHRCFPFSDTRVAGERSLCVEPPCTSSSVSTLPGGVSCVDVDAYPEVTTAWDVCPSNVTTSQCEARRAACELIVKESRTDRYQPESQTETSTKYTLELANFFAMVIGGVNGLVTSEALIVEGLCGLLLPVLMAFVWALFLWLFAGLLIYTLIVVLICVMIALSFFFVYKAGWFGTHINLATIYNSTLTKTATESQQTWYGILAVIFTVITILTIVFFIMSRKAIKRLIAIIEECTKVLKSMAAIVLWPIFFQLPISLGIFFYGAFMAYYIVVVWSETGSMLTFLLLHLILILWTVQFIKATVWTSMSAAVGKWFVTTNAPGNQGSCCGFGTGCSQLTSATGLILMKHLGSMAFGSFIIGICQALRVVLATVDYYTRDLQDKNFLLKLVMKCSQCAVYCLQKTIEFISYFGYIFVATRGESFCKACASTFGFVIKNMAQTAVNNIVQSLLKVLIGWSIPLFCAMITFYILDGLAVYSEAGDHNAMFPALVVFIAAYIIADGICTVYDCCIDTIYLLAFEDMDRPTGPKYMSNDLREGFGFDKAEEEAGKSAAKYQAAKARHEGATSTSHTRNITSTV